jgi:hypothetical protein
MTAAAIGLAYRHPKPRLTRTPPPRALAVTIARYREDFETRSGPLWDYFAARVPALYDGGDRRRSLRSDGADSLLCLIVALLQSMDVRSGFLGRPPIEQGGKWHRRSVLELFGFAYGKPVSGALSVRRIERWIRALKALGILTTRELKHHLGDRVRSVTAIRHVTDRLFELAGTIGQLARERRETAERARAERQARSAANASDSRMDRRGEDQGPDGYRRSDPPPARPSVGTAPRAGPSSAAELLGRITSPLRRP